MSMINSAISRVEISETLAKIRSLSSQNKVDSSQQATETQPSQFSQLLNVAKASITETSNAQLQSEQLKNAYLMGDPKVSVSQVMVSSMESKLAFEGLLVVRNKLLDAYKEIMNMPV